MAACVDCAASLPVISPKSPAANREEKAEDNGRSTPPLFLDVAGVSRPSPMATHACAGAGHASPAADAARRGHVHTDGRPRPRGQVQVHLGLCGTCVHIPVLRRPQTASQQYGWGARTSLEFFGVSAHGKHGLKI